MSENTIDTETLNDAGESTSASIEETLNQRGDRYGNFAHHSIISQTLKNQILQHYYNTHGGPESKQMEPYMLEAIAMICHKLGRIANGDPWYIENWRDISGYSTLVSKQLETTEGASDATVTQTEFKNGKWIDVT